MGAYSQERYRSITHQRAGHSNIGGRRSYIPPRPSDWWPLAPTFCSRLLQFSARPAHHSRLMVLRPMPRLASGQVSNALASAYCDPVPLHFSPFLCVLSYSAFCLSPFLFDVFFATQYSENRTLLMYLRRMFAVRKDSLATPFESD